MLLKNFPFVKRIGSTIAIIGLAFVTALGAAVYSPGIPDIVEEFSVSEEVAILPLSLYTLGLAVGPLIAAPCCETFGRRIIFLISSPLYALFILGSGLSPTITSLLVCRFFAGVCAAPAIGNASATIIDFTAGKARGVTMAFYYSIPQLGAVFGPLVGGFVVQSKGWRWTQWTTIFFIVAFYVPVAFTKETYKKVILQRRAKKLSIPGPPEVQRTPMEFVKYFARTQLLRPLHMLFTELIVTLVCTYNGFLFGLIYTFVVASPWVYEEYYDFDLTGQSLSFLGLSIGAILAPFPIMIIDHYIYQPKLAQFRETHGEDEQFPPEHRLYPAMIASPILPAALLLFGWTARPEIHWIVPILFQCLSMTASVVIYAPANLFMMDTYGPLYGASAAGAAMISRYFLSASFPLFSLQLFQQLGAGWASTVLAACTMVMAPIPYLFFKWGERLRGRIKYEISD